MEVQLAYDKCTLYIYNLFGCAGSSLLCRLFSSCGEGGYSLVTMPGLLIVVASLVVEHRLQGVQASAAEACALRNCGSQAVEQRLSSYGTRA